MIAGTTHCIDPPAPREAITAFLRFATMVWFCYKYNEIVDLCGSNEERREVTETANLFCLSLDP